MKASKKSAAKLRRRQRTHVMTSQESAVRVRWATGGYPAPGSQNRRK